MKKKFFYTHLVEESEITLEIGDLNLTSKERVHLLSLAHANIHSKVVSEVLSNLSEEDKKIFLKNLTSEKHDTTWHHLKDRIENAEEKVKSTIDEIIGELVEDVRQVKKEG